MDVAIRDACLLDAPALAELTMQLGYQVDAQTMAGRLAEVLAQPASVLLVAADDNDQAIGWLHLELHRTLTNPAGVLIAGYVVD